MVIMHASPAITVCCSCHITWQAEMETAYNSLTTVYLGQAEGHEREQRPAEAIEAYNRCLKAADR
jgi:hypothetical protein